MEREAFAMQKEKRNILPDILKGLGIFLVVWGHATGGGWQTASVHLQFSYAAFLYGFRIRLWKI